jgi:hypothetical protein
MEFVYFKDCYSTNMGLYGDSRGRDDGQEENVATPEVHQHGGES